MKHDYIVKVIRDDKVEVGEIFVGLEQEPGKLLVGKVGAQVVESILRGERAATTGGSE